MANGKYNFEACDDSVGTVGEPAISMDYYRVRSFLSRHNTGAGINEAVPLREGFDMLRNRLISKYSEKADSLIS